MNYEKLSFAAAEQCPCGSKSNYWYESDSRSAAFFILGSFSYYRSSRCVVHLGSFSLGSLGLGGLGFGSLGGHFSSGGILRLRGFGLRGLFCSPNLIIGQTGPLKEFQISDAVINGLVSQEYIQDITDRIFKALRDIDY